MWADSPVFRVVVLIGIIFLVVSKESIELDALLEVLDGFEASNMLEEIEISEHVDACSDKSMPVNTLDLNVRVILLELESNGLSEVDVWSLNSVMFSRAISNWLKSKYSGNTFIFSLL